MLTQADNLNLTIGLMFKSKTVLAVREIEGATLSLSYTFQSAG